LNQHVLNRFLEIIKSDYSRNIKEKILYILKRESRKNKNIKRELLNIFESKCYMKKNNLMNRILNKEITDILKEIIRG
ncbi:hypothetical protein, partial [Niallia sp. 03133]|uniref:hypothetical protein n=1 Tax=Niallia sp. 03133 TaxID=3458060 RepID=UPI004043CDC4